MSTDQQPDRKGFTPQVTKEASLRVPAFVLLGGQLLFILVTQFHTGGDANDHRSIFAKYALSEDWKGVHALQFGAVAIMVTGLVALYTAFQARTEGPALTARIGAMFAVVSLALYGVLQAVDGIGNKQVDYAWEHASATDKSARFASAESMRWLEWGLSSYHAYALGLSLLALAAAAMRISAVPRAVAYLMALSGVAWVAQGWVAGSEGFNNTHSALIIVSWFFSLAWMVWLVVIARGVRVTSFDH
jgi:hypothetical protein